MELNKKMRAMESGEIRVALTKSKGNIRMAADALGLKQSTMQDKIRRIYPRLGQYADQLKQKRGQPQRGRPAQREGRFSKKSVKAAWMKHRTVMGTAAALGAPTSTVRNILIEYGLHTPK